MFGFDNFFKCLCLSILLGVTTFSWAGSDYELVFSDEFNSGELNSAQWYVENAFLKKNNETQYYTPEDVYIKEGCLVLTSQKRKYFDQSFTSGLVSTKNKFHFQYGKVEIKARLPFGQGVWPAHWLMNAGNSWPPEIDIMELLGHEKHTVHMTLHYGKWPENRMVGESYTGPDYSAGFHVFSIEWDEKEISWYVDGVKTFHVSENIPEEPFYLVLNTAVGGDWPGFPDETTIFPQFHYIDYVRIYQKRNKNQCFIHKTSVNGTIEIYPEKKAYFRGDEIILKAVPDLDFEFSHWSGKLNSSDSIKLKLTEDLKLEAVFNPLNNPFPVISFRKPVMVSSIENTHLAAENLCDGSLETRWSSEFGDDQWVIVDLLEATDICAIRLYWESAFAKDFQLSVSTDGRNFKSIYRNRKNTQRTQHINISTVKARYIKLSCHTRATEWGFSLYELKVYGKP